MLCVNHPAVVLSNASQLSGAASGRFLCLTESILILTLRIYAPPIIVVNKSV